jgi:hypothetical protein
MDLTISFQAAITYEGVIGGPWHVDLCNPSSIAEKMGRDVLPAFLRCFVGVDRATSLMYMVLANEASRAPENSHARSRDTHLLLLLIAGTMHELGIAIEALGNLKLALPEGPDRIKKLPTWKGMQEIWRRWSADRFGKRVRDQVSHHLGDLDVYDAGLRKLASQPTIQLYVSDGPSEADGSFEGAWAILERGLGLEYEDLRRIVAQTGDDVADVHRALNPIFGEVVNLAGIPVEDRRQPRP